MATDGTRERTGRADIDEGWTMALSLWRWAERLGGGARFLRRGSPSLTPTDW